MIKKFKNYLIQKDRPIPKVYSHPRSGTHFLEAFLALNYYEGKDFFIPNITWGHWSNRKVKLEGNPYGKLFGNHYFADKNNNDTPKVYIIRDGRAVAYSIWKTPNFLHEEISDLSFKEFLRTPIDWYGSPSSKTDANLTMLEHWALHVKSWIQLADENKSILIVRYEDLVNEPYVQYLKIHEKFFKRTKTLSKAQLNIIEEPIGLLPNKAKVDSWKLVFDDEDITYYNAIIDKELINRLKLK